ncbi:serine hydrolase domain-containing protein [Embleya hyalina]|uniref:Serine hydrolase n=1 Tax=Embleya hyalina TaxID=516124 RepID=A0A401YG46_9ACTN|nr:serine hydrolase domain-containing protein [Embleya hyalina]GCD93606.1 serine hydrolase [Embleya hyalina]
MTAPNRIRGRSSRPAALVLGVALTLTAAAPHAATAVAGTDSPTDSSRASRLQRDTDAVHAAGAIGVTVHYTARPTPGGAGTVRTARSGEAELHTGRPLPPNGHYRTGSTTKTFVATVALQLVAEGRLRLDEPIEARLPGVVRGNGNDGRRITLRHLLQHTSGIPGYTALPAAVPALYSARGYRENRFRHYRAEDLVAAALTLPSRFEPGSSWAYSNTNYLLVGLIIRQVTGRSWGEEVRDRIIRPLGLHDTRVPDDDPYLPRPHAQAQHTFAGDTRPTDTTVLNHTVADASGAIHSTPSDIDRFFVALSSGRLLGPAESAEMRRTRAIPDEPGRGYGLGLESTELSCGGRYWQHGGDDLGFSSENGVTDDGRRAVLVVRNGVDENDEAGGARVDAATAALIDHALCAPDPRHP